MSELIERLRDPAERKEWWAAMCLEAADEIERLTERNNELLAALKRIHFYQESLESPPLKSKSQILQDMAREAIAKAESK